MDEGRRRKDIEQRCPTSAVKISALYGVLETAIQLSNFTPGISIVNEFL